METRAKETPHTTCSRVLCDPAPGLGLSEQQAGEPDAPSLIFYRIFYRIIGHRGVRSVTDAYGPGLKPQLSGTIRCRAASLNMVFI